MITQKQAQLIISKVFPAANLNSMVKYKKGLVNENYSISYDNQEANNQEATLRIYKGEQWKVAKEAYLYSLIRQKTDVPVPTVLHIDKSKKIIPWSYAILSHIPGKELHLAYYETMDNRLLEKAGECLAKLHTIHFPSYGWIVGRRISPNFTRWRDFLDYDIRQKLRKLAPFISRDILNDAMAYFRAHEELLSIPTRPSLLHKDYHCSHILASRREITGIIDFEWATAGHSEFDLAKAEWWIGNLIPGSQRHFLKGYRRYGMLSSSYKQRKELYRMVILLGSLVFSHELKKRRWLARNKADLRRIVHG